MSHTVGVRGSMDKDFKMNDKHTYIKNKYFNQQQFDEDLRLNHVKIDPLLFYWNNQNYDATLDLFGYCYQIMLKPDGYRFNRSFPKSTVLKLKQLEETGNGLWVELGGEDKLHMSDIQLELIKEHYGLLNVEGWLPFPIQRDMFKNNINLLISKFLNDKELIQLARNFLETNTEIFFSPRNMLLNEYTLNSIDRENHIGRLLLFLDEESRNQESAKYILKGINIKSIGSDFDMFVKFAQERFNLSDTLQAIYSTYFFLYDVAIQYFSKKWTDEFGEFAPDIISLSLDDAVERYCSIETIIHENEITEQFFIFFLIDNKKFPDNNRNYFTCKNIFSDILKEKMDNKKFKTFIGKISHSQTKREYTIDDIDIMTGKEFEEFIALLFSKLGYSAEVTKTSGDQGIDVILSKDGRTVGVQTKCYSGKIGNSAIQEAVAGKNFYHLDKAMVVTNNFFSPSAQKLAMANSVVLWDRNILKEKILEIFISPIV